MKEIGSRIINCEVGDLDCHKVKDLNLAISEDRHIMLSYLNSIKRLMESEAVVGTKAQLMIGRGNQETLSKE